MSKLSVVSTPIGNLEDITLRALRILREADVIACEDTRHSAILLNKYEIKKPLVSYYKNKEARGSLELLKCLENGKNVALITDAGTPCISDPGSVVVREARNAGYTIEIIPGASALTAAAALCGVEKPFAFIGFLPEKKKARDELLLSLASSRLCLVFYIAPHNYKKDLEALLAAFGDREAFSVREMTKLYEEAVRAPLSELMQKEPKGEYVLIVDGSEIKNELLSLSVKEHLDYYLKLGYDKKTAIRLTADDRALPRNEVYQIAIAEEIAE